MAYTLQRYLKLTNGLFLIRWSVFDTLVAFTYQRSVFEPKQLFAFAFYLCSVLFLFCSLFVLFRLCSFALRVCVCVCSEYDKGPWYIIPRPRPRPDPTRPRLLFVPILLLVPTILGLFLCHLAMFHCVRDPVCFKLAPVSHHDLYSSFCLSQNIA